MKNPTLATLCLAAVLTLGLRGLAVLPPAEITVTPTISPAGGATQIPALSTVTSTLPPTSMTPPATSTRPPTVSPNGTITGTATITPTRTLTATHTLTPTHTLTVTATITPSATPSLIPTLDGQAAVTNGVPVASQVNAPAAPKYVLAFNPQALAIDSLRARTYGGAPIKVTRILSSNDAFKKVIFEYTSDGLRITGMMNIPQGIGPFPVVILDHGYFKPAEYKTGDGTIRAADDFARHGYLTLAPDYRCYGGSQCGTNPLDVGYAVDVLNLIGSLSSLPYADTGHIGIWGHSMGGGVTIRVLAISDQIKVAALYGAVTGDDETHYCWLNGCRTPVAATREPRSPRLGEIDPDFLLGVPTAVSSAPDPLAKLREIFNKSSPTRYLQNINAAVMIHHGEADDMVPIQWSGDLTAALTAQGKTASLYTYPGEGHVFGGSNWQLFMARNVSFFNEYLNPRGGPFTVEQRVLRQERGISGSY